MSDLIIYGRCSRFSEPCGLWIDLSDLIYRVDAADKENLRDDTGCRCP